MKVLIVDDEPVVRVGLKSMIDWQGKGYELVGEASDGEKALEMIKKYKPDILITDIKMPVMDGLELIERSHELFPHMQVIVLSSYDDFQLVKQVMKLGAVDYCLKLEIEPDDLMDLLERIRKDIESHKMEEMKQSSYDAHVRENLPVMRGRFLKQILFGEEKDRKKLYNAMEFLNLNLDLTNIFCMLLKSTEMHRFESMEEDKLHRLNVSIRNIAEEIINDDFRGYCFEMKTGLFCLLFSQKDKKALNGDPEGLIMDTGHRLKDILKQYLDIGVVIGIGKGGAEGIEGIKSAYRSALKALEHRFFAENDGIILWKHISQEAIPACDKYSILNYKHKLQMALAFHEEETLSEIINGILDDLTNMPLSQEAMCNTSLELYYILSEFFEKYQFNMEDILKSSYKSFRELLDIGSTAQVKHWLQGVLNDLIDFIRQEHQSDYPRIITKAQTYIEDHYEHDISLKEVAEFVNLNPSYFSTLFKQYTGVSFTDYLTQIRIEKAKALLRKTDYKVYEIAQMTGYHNVYYFNRIFKKITGTTPVGYKNSMKV